MNRPLDTPKQGPQRGSDNLRLFKPRKVGKLLQDLAIGRSEPDRGLAQLRWRMQHDIGCCNPDAELCGERMAEAESDARN